MLQQAPEEPGLQETLSGQPKEPGESEYLEESKVFTGLWVSARG